jgi:hypothetical protein
VVPVENFIKRGGEEEKEKGRGGEARGPVSCLALGPQIL